MTLLYLFMLCEIQYLSQPVLSELFVYSFDSKLISH